MQPISGVKLTALGEHLAAEDFKQLAERNLQGDLEPNDASRIHILCEALYCGRVWEEDSGNARFSPELAHVAAQSQVFVVRHNWGAVLAGAIAEADEVRLPYELCAFEFKLRGSPAILFAYQVQQQGPIAWRVTWEVASQPVRLWRVGQDSGLGADLIKLLSQQVRSICVALDAEIATSTVVPAPEALNRKRERTNKPPLLAYHVVDLNRRTAGQGGATANAVAGIVRLHFRRGHWRHLDSGKVWVDWCLVGNPDLGWVDKEYRI